MSEDRHPGCWNSEDRRLGSSCMGDVIDDIAAMASADVAIGLAEDGKGFISKTICDVMLGGVVLWIFVFLF